MTLQGSKGDTAEKEMWRILKDEIFLEGGTELSEPDKAELKS